MEKIYAEILMATYNGERFVRQQLDSLLAQDDDRWHLTVSDDGSTDSTPQILDEYAAAHPDKITRHISGTRFGNARDHFFHLMETCDAPYMLFCDQDDVWYPGKVRTTLDALIRTQEKHGADTPVLVFTDQTPVDVNLSPIAPSLMRYQQQDASVIDYRRILLQNIVTGCATGINRALAQRSARLQNRADTIMHDWWVGVVAAKFGQLVYLDESTMAYRQHGSNSVGAKDVGSLSHVIEKLSHLDKLKKTIAQKKRQAQAFADTYANELSEEDIAFLRQLAKPHSGLAFYLKHRGLFTGIFRFAGTALLG